MPIEKVRDFADLFAQGAFDLKRELARNWHLPLSAQKTQAIHQWG
jgi:hypothetical protein